MDLFFRQHLSDKFCDSETVFIRLFAQLVTFLAQLVFFFLQLFVGAFCYCIGILPQHLINALFCLGNDPLGFMLCILLFYFCKSFCLCFSFPALFFGVQNGSDKFFRH